MFSGNQEVHSDREVLVRNIRFLVQNKVMPIPSKSVRIPMLSFHDRTTNLDLYVAQVTGKIKRVIDFSLPHQVLVPSAREWQDSTEDITAKKIANLCSDIAGHVLRVGSPQEELFAFMGFAHRPIFKTAANRNHVFADIAYGISTRLGDGGRYVDRDGHTSFDQMKGTRTRSVHFYIRNTAG